MQKVGLPMNFQVNECNESKCRDNAYASMDRTGTRNITYDNAWFSKIDSSKYKLGSLTILAHEIGHHLAAHTLSLNYRNHLEACSYCHPRSSKYDPIICKAKYHAEYLEYLKQRRSHELQADRFAGFIMAKFGSSYEDIAVIYNCLLYTSPSPRDQRGSRMPSSA